MQVSRIYRTNQTFFQLILSLALCLLLLAGCAPKQPASMDATDSILPIADAANLPEVIQSLLTQSDSQYLKHNYSGALATLERALRISPRHAEIWSRMAQVYLQQGDLEQARQHAKRSNSVVKNNTLLKDFNNDIIELKKLTPQEPLH
jgi:Flp pilus assembly protein TadD